MATPLEHILISDKISQRPNKRRRWTVRWRPNGIGFSKSFEQKTGANGATAFRSLLEEASYSERGWNPI
jgi:hypothetical protein